MNREDIEIQDPTQTALANFEMLENRCEVLTASLINGEALDIRVITTQVREGGNAGHKRRVDREEGDMRALK